MGSMNTNSTAFYSILGLNKADNPSEADIKRAYKKQALKWHPDRNRGTKKEAAEKKFKEINAAYEILSDSKKRKVYDQYGQDVAEGKAGPTPDSGMGGSGMPAGFSFGGMPDGMGGMPAGFRFSSNSMPGGMGGHQYSDPNDIFASVFGGEGGGLEGLFAGMGGRGMGGMGGMGGVGSMGRMGGMRGRPARQRSGVSKRNLECSFDELANGCVKRLKVTSNDRMTQQPVSEIVTVTVKPGWKPGTKITFTLKTGDQVQFTVAQKKHRYLTREGNNLKWVCQLSEKQATKGVNLTLSTPVKGETVKLCTKGMHVKDGIEMTVTGKGMPIKGDLANRGDLVVQFKIPIDVDVG
jgi:DnaJ family protein B protein 4